MPNWCYNEMTITASCEEAQEQAKEFISKSIIKTEKTNMQGEKYTEEDFTFKGVYPMPKSLEITSGSAVDDAMCLLKAKEGDLSDITEYAKNPWTYESDRKLYSKDTPLKEKIKIAMEHLEDTLEVNDLTEGQMALDNIKKYGYANWYQWSINKWGTKWDACNATVEDISSDYIFIRFDTAWSPPEGYIEELSAKFPLLEIQVRVTEESDAFMGFICATDGQINASYAEPTMPH